MRNFNNIIYASTGIGDDVEGLKQALSLARNNNAALKFLLVYPELPSSQAAYRDKFREFMAEQVETAVQAARAALNMDAGDAPVRVEMESSDSCKFQTIPATDST